MESKGKINLYQCPKCYWKAFTLNMHSGTTPFTVRCGNDDCGLSAYPGFYRATTNSQTSITHMFYFPSPELFKTLDAPTKKFVLEGCMLFAPLASEPVLTLTVPEEVRSLETWRLFTAETYSGWTDECQSLADELEDYYESMRAK